MSWLDVKPKLPYTYAGLDVPDIVTQRHRDNMAAEEVRYGLRAAAKKGRKAKRNQNHRRNLAGSVDLGLDAGGQLGPDQLAAHTRHLESLDYEYAEDDYAAMDPAWV